MKFSQIIIAATASALVFVNSNANDVKNTTNVEEDEDATERNSMNQRSNNQPSTRIVGGRPVGDNPEIYQFIASLNDHKYGHFCGAAAINDRWLITAAHCMEGGPVDFAIVGTHNLKKYPTQRQDIDVKRKIKHSGYNKRTLKNDIALVELKNPIQGLKPIMLADSEKFITPGQSVKIIGWGATKFGKDVEDRLREVTVPIVSEQTCTAPGSYLPKEIFDTNICAGLPKGGKDSCQGDSGGPMFVDYGEGKQVLTGIVSWGTGCAWKKKYGVYTKVSDYIGWIQSKIKGTGIQIAPESIANSRPSSQIIGCGKKNNRKCNKAKKCEWQADASPYQCVPK